MSTLDPHENPYHPFEETTKYHAFEEGWAAHHRGQPVSDLPYSLAEAESALAWLDGWTAAEDNEGSVRERRRDGSLMAGEEKSQSDPS